MTPVAERIETLVVARARMISTAASVGDLIKPLVRFAPVALTPAAWRDQLAEIVAELRGRDVLDADHRLHDPDELTRRLGKIESRGWPDLADRVLPALGLGIAASDARQHARLAGRDAWAAAIVGRALGLWTDGPAPSLPAVCDALVWRELGIASKPKHCPAEIRAVFLRRQLGSDSGPPERGVRLLAAREVNAPRPELRALRDALVRGWLAGRELGAVRPAARGELGAASRAADVDLAARVVDSERPAARGELGAASRAADVDLAVARVADSERPAARGELGATSRAADVDPAVARVADSERPAARGELGAASRAGEVDPARGAGMSGDRSFAEDVRQAASQVVEGRFGDRKVFVSAVWEALRRDPRWAAVSLDELKSRLVAAHRAGELVLARADLVAAMDPALVAASEITADGASFHFVVQEPGA